METLNIGASYEILNVFMVRIRWYSRVYTAVKFDSQTFMFDYILSGPVINLLLVLSTDISHTADAP